MEFEKSSLKEFLEEIPDKNPKLIEEIRLLRANLAHKEQELSQSFKDNKIAFAQYFFYGIGLEKIKVEIIDFDFEKIETSDNYDARFIFTLMSGKNQKIIFKINMMRYENFLSLSTDGIDFHYLDHRDLSLKCEHKKCSRHHCLIEGIIKTCKHYKCNENRCFYNSLNEDYLPILEDMPKEFRYYATLIIKYINKDIVL